MSDKITEEIKKAFLKQVQAGVIQPATIVFGDNVQHKVENNYYGTAEPKQQHVLPSALATTQAMEYWHKAQEAGWIDENFQPLISNPKAALLADYIGRKIGLVDRWVPFTQLWGIKNLSKDFDRANCSKEGGIFLDLMKEKLE